MAKRKTTVQILKDARALLVKNGWCQFVFEDKAGRFCALGAINKAMTGHSGDVTLPRLAPYKALAAAIGEKWSAGVYRIAPWNNDAARTKREVLAAFSRAIKAEEAKKARA